MSEGVKLGIQQFVGINTNNVWKQENSRRQDKPIICWMQDWKGCQTPPMIDFKYNQSYGLGTTYKYTISHEEYESNPLFRVDTPRIVTYRTSFGGEKNENTKVPLYDKRLKDLNKYATTFDVPVHVNGQILKFNYTANIQQRPTVQ